MEVRQSTQQRAAYPHRMVYLSANQSAYNDFIYWLKERRDAHKMLLTIASNIEEVKEYQGAYHELMRIEHLISNPSPDSEYSDQVSEYERLLESEVG